MRGLALGVLLERAAGQGLQPELVLGQSACQVVSWAPEALLEHWQAPYRGQTAPELPARLGRSAWPVQHPVSCQRRARAPCLASVPHCQDREQLPAPARF
ncbi:hypothetical protein GCM10027456_75970 [Kineosporia babensis]